MAEAAEGAEAAVAAEKVAATAAMAASVATAVEENGCHKIRLVFLAHQVPVILSLSSSISELLSMLLVIVGIQALMALKGHKIQLEYPWMAPVVLS